MDLVSRIDEPEPAGRQFFQLLPLGILILFISCNDSNEHQVAQRKAVSKDSSRFVIRKLPSVIVTPPAKVKKQKKKIYLTFDDGPNKGTRNVLDIVQQEQIPVTFFIVGEHVFASIEQARDWDSLLTASNIELCNHSYTHAHNKYEHFYELPETVVKDMERTKNELLPANNIVRAPGRNSWRIDSLHFTDIQKSKPAMDSLQKAGFVVMGWDLEWHYDPKTLQVKNSADELMQQVDSLFKKKKTRIPDNLVILAHDQVYRSAADSLQLREFIQKLKTRDDYELALVSNYPAIRLAKVDSIQKVAVVPQQLDTIRKKVDSL